MYRAVSLSLLCALCASLAAPAEAALIEIQFTGLDVVYDGSVISDAEPTGHDELDTATLKVDGVHATGSPFVAGVAIDLSIPGVLSIPVSGGTVLSAAGGTLDLTLPGGDYLALTLSEAEVTYLDGGASLGFALAGTLAGVSGQSLPDGLYYDSVVEVSFSTNVLDLSDDGTHLTGFVSRGSGEIFGSDAPAIPEPATALLCGLAATLLAAGRRV